MNFFMTVSYTHLKYQKFKIDELPLILNVEPWDYRDYIAYLKWRYKENFKPIKPVKRRSECDINENCKCPRCNAKHLSLQKQWLQRSAHV